MPDEQPLSPLDAFAALNLRLDDSAALSERGKRIAMLTDARNYYDGYHPKHLTVKAGEFDPNIIINLCRSIVNKSVAWLFGDVLRGEFLDFDLRPDDQVSDDGAEPGDYTEPEAWLTRVWMANGGARLLQRLGRRGAISGHVFVKVVPETDPDNATGLPRLVVLQPDRVSVVTRGDDDDTAEAYVIEWAEMARRGGKAVQVRQVFARLDGAWWVGQFADTGRGKNKWVPTVEPAVWPYTWCPIVEWQNQPNDDGYYGLSDLEDLTSINDGLNFLVSNTNKILYLHGHPKTIGTGFEADAVQDTAIDAFWTVPNPEAKVYNLEMQSDLSSAANLTQFLQRAFWDIGRDMDLSTLQDRIGQVTNFGLRVLASAALEKLGEKRLAYGGGLDRLNRALLELGGYPQLKTVVHWRNPLPEDQTDEVQRLKAELEMGLVSKETASRERGRDWEEEQQRIANDQAAGTNLGALLLGSFERGGVAGPLRPGGPIGPGTPIFKE